MSTPSTSAVAAERKVVTVLFADVVGSTELAEQLDPERVAQLLGTFWQRAREELERRGGTVEKYVGDAVLALFGVPAAHEDDTARAVAAALAIRDWARTEQLVEVRVGVATGEALVRLDAQPLAGEGAAVGDVVNTAARLQQAAPVNGVLVDAATHDATRRWFGYEPAGAVAAKGKARPVAAWVALAAVVEPPAQPQAPFVGRSTELALLEALFERTVATASPQLVTVVGAPGIGKTRLVEELHRRLGDRVDWLQGRTPPYDEGGGPAAALAAAVRARAGRRLESLLELLADDEAAGRVRALVAPVAAPAALRDDRIASFAAWRRLLEALAAERPVVLALDDLQWADDLLLEFVDHLVEWAVGAPLLVVATARPELHDLHPAWGGGKGNATTLTLGPLNDEETARLLGLLLQRAAVEVSQRLRERTGGNPLYAEQFARMLLEREDAETVPRSVQAVIGARIDALPAAEKRVLEDAAAAGEVFVAAAFGLGADDEALHALARKELLVRGRVRGEFAFAHALVREAAYARLPHARRAELHRRLADWLATADPRPEVLAYHCTAALEAARITGARTEELEARARVALRAAGERALAVNAFPAAADHLRAALALWPHDGPERAQLLLRLGHVLWLARTEGERELLEARDLFRAAGDRDREAEAEALLCELAWYQGDLPRSWRHLDAAATLVEDAGPSPTKAYALARLSRQLMLGAHYDRAVEVGREALALAESFGLAELQANVLNSIGSARARAGDVDGLHDVERAAELSGSVAAVVAYNNLASLHGELGDLRTSNAYLTRARELAERIGNRSYLEWSDRELTTRAVERGDWDAVVAAAPRFGGGHYLEATVRCALAFVLQARGDGDAARAEAAQAEEAARRIGEPQILLACLGDLATVALLGGETTAAEAYADELIEIARSTAYMPPAASFALAVVLDAVGRGDELPELLDGFRQRSRWFDAARAYAAGDYAGAAELYGEIGDLSAQAYAWVQAGDSRGEDFYASVGATPPRPTRHAVESAR